MQLNNITAPALLITTCVIWGIQPMFAKFVVREMSPIPMVSIRYTVVALTLFVMLKYRGEPLVPPRKTWLALFVMGILGVCINNVTQFTGLKYSTVTNFTIIATLHAHRYGAAQLCADPRTTAPPAMAGHLQQPVRRAVPFEPWLADCYFSARL